MSSPQAATSRSCFPTLTTLNLLAGMPRLAERGPTHASIPATPSGVHRTPFPNPRECPRVSAFDPYVMRRSASCRGSLRVILTESEDLLNKSFA